MGKPKIRFEGYSEDWEQRKLGEIITEYKETVDSDCTLPILTSSKTEGVILQEEHFGRKQQHDITGYNILPRNYCTYRNRSDGVDFTFNINKCCDKGIISKFYPVFSGKNSDVFFLSLVLNNSDEVVREIAYTCTGPGQKVLSFLDLQKMKVRVPSFDEQKEIAAYFDSLDHLITLHQRKCDEIKTLKKYMLQKMFPQNGEKVPEIRFDGFTEDWEQRKLGDVAQEFRSGNSLKADEIDITGDYPVYGGNGLRGYTSTYNHDGEYALIGRQGALCGNMNYSVGKAYFTEHAVVVKADENNDTRFLYYMLDTMNLGQYSDQSAQPGLAVNKLVKLENRFPTKEEQQRMGWYFSNIDHLITLHQRKCNELKEIKKYMLQNMFV